MPKAMKNEGKGCSNEEEVIGVHICGNHRNDLGVRSRRVSASLTDRKHWFRRQLLQRSRFHELGWRTLPGVWRRRCHIRYAVGRALRNARDMVLRNLY